MSENEQQKDEKKVIFVTDDSAMKRGKIHEVDKSVLHSAKTGEGTFEIKTAEQLKAFAELAVKTHDVFLESIKAKMTKPRAELIRKLRVEDGCSWRALAAECHENWAEDAEWLPPSNQIAGMALCEVAAEMFGEKYMEAPWN